ncbi:hypothetical protein, partial [Aeromonas salmonicida]|uniref:hypothetical protein n=1 Tax=Aeromonas salmonicida TaxID=645 RepID=UPI00224050D1
MLCAIRSPRLPTQHAWQQTKSHAATRPAIALDLPPIDTREFNFEVQFPIKNQAAFRSSSKTTCGCLNPKHLRGLKFSRFS